MDIMEGIRGLSGIKFWLRVGWAIFSWTHFGSSLRGLLPIFLEEAKVTTDGVGFPTITATARRPGALSSMVSQRKSLRFWKESTTTQGSVPASVPFFSDLLDRLILP